MIIEKHLQIINPELSVTQTLNHELELKISEIKQAIKKGCLWLQDGKKIKRLRRLKTVLRTGQQLHFYYNPEILLQKPELAELIEDNSAYSVWYKPAGMLCQGSKWGDHTTIYRYAEQHLEPERNAIIVHRLDRMTSGLIILAHQRKVAAAFTKLFEKRAIEKNYHMIAHGHFKTAKNSITIDKAINNKPAVSHVQLIQYNQQHNKSILDVCIETGRKHQIRQHLAMAGYPVVGDRLYGVENTTESVPDLQLIAYKLSFKCPVSKEIKQYELDKSKLTVLSCAETP